MSDFINRLRRPVSVWIISLLLCIVSFDGFLSFPGILHSLSTTPQYLVAICHITYSVTGIAIVTGIWCSARPTWVAIIIWGVTSLGAAIGGPLAFGSGATNLLPTIFAVSFIIILITYGLLWYVRRITRTKGG